MKRFISLLLSFVMLFQLTACGGAESGTETGTDNTNGDTPKVESILPESEIPTIETKNGDIIPDTDDFYASQQTIFAQLNEKSIGANKDLVATLKNDAPAIQYELNEKDYDYFFCSRSK